MNAAKIRIEAEGSPKIVGALQGHPLLVQEASNNLKTWKFVPSAGNTAVELVVTYEFRTDNMHKTQESVFVSRMDLPNRVLVRAQEFKFVPDGIPIRKPWWKRIF